MQSIEEYLRDLKNELRGSDVATVHDALSDAEEHLRNAVAALREAQPELSEAEALEKTVEQYGSPAETAAAYGEVERRTSPVVASKARPDSAWQRFFGVYSDPHAWGTLLYMVISFLTGFIYLSWVVLGFSVSLTFSLFIFGIPLAILFLLSVRGLALLEGRLVEALLGERMPRRPFFTDQSGKWLERFKVLLADKRTWLAMVYMLLQQILGFFYFTLVFLAFGLSLVFVAAPVVQSILHVAVLTVGSTRYFLPGWAYPLMILFGLLLWTVFMHVGRGIGQWHGRYAKAMLVTE